MIITEFSDRVMLAAEHYLRKKNQQQTKTKNSGIGMLHTLRWLK